MGEAFSDVTLKLSLQVDGQRLDRLDTSALDQSLKEAEKRIEASGAAAAAKFQAKLDGVRMRGPAGLGGGPAGGGVGGLTRDLGDVLPWHRKPGSGPNDNLGLRELPEERERLINRRSFAPESGGSQSPSSAQSPIGNVWNSYNTEAIKVQDRATQSLTETNSRLAGTLGKVSNGLALGVVGYRALTQVNGEHVNVLGEFESRLESSAIGMSLVTRGTNIAVSSMNKFGITVGAGGAALAALPIAAAVGGLYLLVKAQAELARQQQINLALDEKIAAGMDARRQREIAKERLYVDAIIGQRKRLAELAPEQADRDAGVRNRQIGLTSDPAQRGKEFEAEGLKLFEQIEQKKFEAEKARVQGRRRLQADDDKGAQASFENQRRFLQEADALERRRTQAIEGQREAVKEISDARKDKLKDELRESERNEETQRDFGGLSAKGQAAARRKGDAPEIGGRASGDVAAELAKVEAAAKRKDEVFIALLKNQASNEDAITDKLDDALAKQEAFGDSLGNYFTRVQEILKFEQARANAAEKKLAELGSSVGRGRVNGRG